MVQLTLGVVQARGRVDPPAAARCEVIHPGAKSLDFARSPDQWPAQHPRMLAIAARVPPRSSVGAWRAVDRQPLWSSNAWCSTCTACSA